METTQPTSDAIENEKQLFEQTQKDQQTIFVLAALMTDLYVATIQRNAQAIGNILPKVGNLLKGNQGFVERFKLAQAVVLKDAGLEVKPKSQIVMP